jgi:glucose-6-phosphate 1-dehydrogenase
MTSDSSRRQAPSDVLVLFGATGDLARKRIFPALYAMCKRGALNVPVIGVASSALSIEQFRARARESVELADDVCERPVLERMLALLRYVGGNYKAAATFDALKTHPACSRHCRRSRKYVVDR